MRTSAPRGYACERGEIFYAQTRQRVPVEPVPELIAQTLEIVAEARSAAARLAPLPPLESGPKCPRCSLVGICLPDETNLLAGRNDGKPRRLITAAPDAVPLYVTEPSMVGIDGGRLTVSKHREPLASVRLIDVLHVCAYGNVQVTAQTNAQPVRAGHRRLPLLLRRLAARIDDGAAEQERDAADPADHHRCPRAAQRATAHDRREDSELPGAAAR